MRSMTGFGQASWEGKGLRLAVEVRSVNQRFLDIKLSLPRECQMWEPELRNLVARTAERGKVEVTISRSGHTGRQVKVEVDETLARVTLNGWRRLQRRLGVPGTVDLAFLRGRGEFVRMVDYRPDASAELPRVRRLLGAALAVFNRAREREGRALARDMRARLTHLRRIDAALRRRTTELVPELARRVTERVRNLLGSDQISQERLIQEAALLAERADVTEELVRLSSHLERLGNLLRQPGAVGKPIDFLLQEIHREINTVASKSADLAVTQLTLEARAEVEKLREQAQNVE